ncbi:MAG: hypothetical protein JOZ81_33570 [Chloroflexi bacterium]|nr:hypothetical protein [Chloroflexota bacterium]MBV9546076.1 hypothetical protein [Chloroflexota bacterium]
MNSDPGRECLRDQAGAMSSRVQRYAAVDVHRPAEVMLSPKDRSIEVEQIAALHSGATVGHLPNALPDFV